MNIGDLVRVKTTNRFISDGWIGVIAGIVGDHYYTVSFGGDHYVYSDVAMEVIA